MPPLSLLHARFTLSMLPAPPYAGCRHFAMPLFRLLPIRRFRCHAMPAPLYAAAFAMRFRLFHFDFSCYVISLLTRAIYFCLLFFRFFSRYCHAIFRRHFITPCLLEPFSPPRYAAAAAAHAAVTPSSPCRRRDAIIFLRRF
jgi:hypothetical protein